MIWNWTSFKTELYERRALIKRMTLAKNTSLDPRCHNKNTKTLYGNPDSEYPELLAPTCSTMNWLSLKT